ncbi:MAG: hypothetical protein BWY82_02083 [Verrucomicrobia bacterium ADurb.Bin474]|nr:MAG: hypothetical protein BWY82_02083 [Verrucomicrobia bacterium ADurb.Bin474]
MHTSEIILPFLQRLQNRTVTEPFGHPEIPLITRKRIKIRHHLVHPSMLRDQHGLHLPVIQTRQQGHTPIPKTLEQNQGLSTFPVHPCVPQTREGLVDIVERHPSVIQPESVGLDLTRSDVRPNGRATGNASDVTRPERILATFQFIQHVIQATLKLPFRSV